MYRDEGALLQSSTYKLCAMQIHLETLVYIRLLTDVFQSAVFRDNKLL